MLTYITKEQYKQSKDVGRAGAAVLDTLPASAEQKIEEYIKRATRFIDRFTRRSFFPSIETRRYNVPYAHQNLAIRRYPSAHLKLDNDLLESLVVNNGQVDIPDDNYFLLEHNIYPKSIIAINFPYYWGGTYGAIAPYKRYDSPVISLTGIWGFADYRYPAEFWIDTDQVLLGDIDNAVTTITLDAVDDLDSLGENAFFVGCLIRIDNEFMEVTAIDTGTNEITVRRGMRGSTKASHDEDAVITRWRVIEDIQTVCIQVAKTWMELDLNAGGRIGVSDTSVGAELGIPQDALTTIKMYQRSIIFG
jgi:hypothetical protein